MLPDIAKYNQEIQQRNVQVFKTNKFDAFVPCKERPIRIYSYSAGSFAVVFKTRRQNTSYAIRCFISSNGDTPKRYMEIEKYVKGRTLPWLVNFQYYASEMQIDDNYYPVIIMDWVDGIPINKYIDQILYNKTELASLQSKLITLSKQLTENNIGHGDLQSGNVFITNADHSIRLLDYDCMYVPALASMGASEIGHPEFKHPLRAMSDYNPRVDWFSIWVMITALEALKKDPTLWNKPNQGGFNTLTNFLFTADDFLNPAQSVLFNKLLNKGDSRLNWYLNKLIASCRGMADKVPRPELFEQEPFQAFSPPPTPGKFIVKSNKPSVVLSNTFQKITTTPCELDKSLYSGKNIILSCGSSTKTIKLVPEKELYEIDFA